MYIYIKNIIVWLTYKGNCYEFNGRSVHKKINWMKGFWITDEIKKNIMSLLIWNLFYIEMNYKKNLYNKLYIRKI